MPVVLVIAAVAILAGVVVVAVGRGGELAMFRSDVPPVQFALFTPGDVAAFRPRLAFFGYSARATDDALLQIARAVAERDAELSRLRVQLTALRDQMEDAAREADNPWPPAAGRAPEVAWPSAAGHVPDDAWPPAADHEPATDPQPAVTWPVTAADQPGAGMAPVPVPAAFGGGSAEAARPVPEQLVATSDDLAAPDDSEPAGPAAGHEGDPR